MTTSTFSCSHKPGPYVQHNCVSDVKRPFHFSLIRKASILVGCAFSPNCTKVSSLLFYLLGLTRDLFQSIFIHSILVNLYVPVKDLPATLLLPKEVRPGVLIIWNFNQFIINKLKTIIPYFFQSEAFFDILSLPPLPNMYVIFRLDTQSSF